MGLKTYKKNTTWFIRKMQIKIMLKYHFSSIRLAMTLKLANSLAGKGKRGLSYIAGGTINWHNSTKGNLAISIKIANAPTIWPSNFTSRPFICQKAPLCNELQDICGKSKVQKNLHNIYALEGLSKDNLLVYTYIHTKYL